MSVASEYDIPWIKNLAAPECIRSLDANNLKDIWQAGRLYDSASLKNACIDYTKKNALSVLANGGIMCLQIEDPASWEEFAKAITPTK
jgi:hypothetical protein